MQAAPAAHSLPGKAGKDCRTGDRQRLPGCRARNCPVAAVQGLLQTSVGSWKTEFRQGRDKGRRRGETAACSFAARRETDAGTHRISIDPALKQLNGMKEEQPQILRLTTPRLKSVWGPVRSG